MKGLFAFLPALLILTPSANADGYCRSRQATYYAPTYSTYTPYVAPAYKAPAYVAPDYAPYLKTVLYPANPDYYSSSNDYYRDAMLVNALAGKVTEVLKKEQERQEYQSLKEEVLNLRRQLLYGPQQPMPQAQPQQQQYQPQAPPEQAAPQKQPIMPPAVGKLPPASEKFKAAVQTSCLRCHGANNASAGGGIDLQNLDACPRELRLLVKAAIDDGSMPKGGKPLPDDIAAEAHRWATGRSGTASAQK